MPDFNEIAHIKDGRDWTRGWVGSFHKWLPNTDRLLEIKSGGDLQLYEQVAQDDQVKSCLQQRFRALISHDWEVIPAGEKRQDRQIADFVTAQLKNLRWDDTVEKMLWGIFYGYSIAEVIWEKQADKVGIKTIKVRDQRRFHFDEDFKPRLRTLSEPYGEALPDQKFWHFSCGHHHDDEPYGRGLAHWLYWMVFFKKNDIRWWIRFLELYAQPARQGKYPAAATDAEKNVLWGALAAFGVDGRMMIPEGLDIELVEASRSGTADYEALLKQINEAIAKIILSQTMTTDSGSSLSQAQVHQDVGESVIMADADLICASFNTSVVKWLCDFNFPGIDVYPKFAYKLDSAPDLKSLADRDKVLSDMGFPPTEEYIVATYGEGFRQDPALAKNTRLNGGQVTALTGLLSQATQSAWSAETLETALSIAFPQVAPDHAIKLAKSLTAQTPADSAQTPADSPPEDLSTLFSSGLAEGAIKKVKGRDYRLTNSRWRRVGDGADLETGTRIPDQKLTKEAIKKSKDTSHLDHLAKKLEGSADVLQSHMDSGKEGFDKDVEALRDLADVARAKSDRIAEKELDKEIEDEMEKAPHRFKVSKSANSLAIERVAENEDYGGLIKTSSPLTITIKPNQSGGHEVRLSDYESSFADANGQPIPGGSKLAASIHQIDGLAIDKITEKSKQMAVESWLTKNVFDKLKTTAYFQATERTDPVLELTSAMQAQDHFKPWLQQIQGLLTNSGDLAEFQTALESAFPELDPADFRAAMIVATTVASLGGYSDSTDSQN